MPQAAEGPVDGDRSLGGHQFDAVVPGLGHRAPGEAAGGDQHHLVQFQLRQLGAYLLYPSDVVRPAMVAAFDTDPKLPALARLVISTSTSRGPAPVRSGGNTDSVPVACASTCDLTK
ncbi:hypothetical protein GCM10010177_79860 [Actinomadura citrea]|nr:hypothetical protein GCM10010177_79860 [Actinomadura citrea]